ncbi:MAG: glycosyltransferase [Acidobacteria bacterium]|jgi:glycosyltransferase involved in cell wall biosynthesis|nr:glycosyltransferase [Acidobacteriota bacterium]
MEASVIVCTYNRSALLRRLLEALANQTAALDSFEIIVVNDGSTDNTADVCQSMKERLPHMKVITMPGNSGLSAAGNQGVNAASGRFILFTDDDCIPNTDWVENMCRTLNDSPIAAGAMISPVSNYFKLCHNIAQFYPFMPGQKARTLDFIAGANMGFQKHVMKDIGSFREDTIIPDMEYILRARQKGYSITYGPDAAITHDPPRVTSRDVLHYSALHASHTILMRLQHREMLRTPFILFSPFFILLTAPLIALKVTAGIYLGNRELRKHWSTIPTVYLVKLAWCWGAARGLYKSRRK